MPVNDESYLIKKVDEIAVNITDLLVGQSKSNEKLENISKVTAENATELKNHEARLTKIESTMLILKWLLGILTPVLIAVTVTLITRIIGG